jgi:phosphoribosylaminoimidazole-succinocarboxamide synthase
MTTETIPLPHFHSGKVRETYENPLNERELFPYATDRFSTHNVVHLTPITHKGELLTALSVYWAVEVLTDFDTHLLDFGKKIYDHLPKDRNYPDDFHLRTLAVRRREPELVEYVWRRYSTGSYAKLLKKLKERRAAGEEAIDPYELDLPFDLPHLHRFDEPAFTPTDKSATDDPRSSPRTCIEYPASTVNSKRLFLVGEQHLHARGIALLDMKCEMDNGMLIDEWLTGDCCRMVYETDLASAIKNGMDPHWLDKEEGRQIAESKWGTGPRVPLTFSPEEVERIAGRYHEAFRTITGMTLDEFQSEYFD